MGIYAVGQYTSPQGIQLSNVYVSLHDSTIVYAKKDNRLIYSYSMYADRTKEPLETVQIYMNNPDVSDIFKTIYSNIKNEFSTFDLTDDF